MKKVTHKYNNGIHEVYRKVYYFMFLYRWVFSHYESKQFGTHAKPIGFVGRTQNFSYKNGNGYKTTCF